MGRKRQEIAAAADRVFYAEGFAQVGIDRIVDQAGVALGTLYKEFPGRTPLIVAALEHREAAYFAALDEAAGRRQGADRILSLFDALHDWSAREGGNGCFFLRAAADHPQSPEIRGRALAHKRAYLSLIARHLRAGGWTPARSRRLAPTVFLLLEGAVAAAATLGDGKAIEEGRKAARILLAATPPDRTLPDRTLPDRTPPDRTPPGRRGRNA